MYKVVMKYIDITLPLSNGLVTYPGNVVFERQLLKTIDKDDAELSKLVIGTHAGTHVDAPRHFIKGGKGIDQVEVQKLIGPCKVIDCTYVEEFLTARDFEGSNIKKGDRLLIKTRNSDYITDVEFVPNFVSLSLEAAQFLANKEISLVGIDYLSIEAKGSPGHPVHKALLKHEIVVIEGLNLSEVDPGGYQLVCLPLKIQNGDGAPCRVLLGI